MSPFVVKEDFFYAFAHINIQILLIPMVSLYFVTCWHLLISNEDKELKEIKSGFNTPIKFKNKSVTAGTISFIIISILLLVFYLSHNNFNLGDFIFVIFFLLIIPLCYIFVKSKRPIIVVLYFFFTILFGMHFINQGLADVNNKKTKSNNVAVKNIEIVTFKYEGRHIISSYNHNCFFKGHKYFLFYNKDSNKVSYYETSKISHLETRNVEHKDNIQIDSIPIN